MGPLGKYWLFFVIVAVGLALSWGQVGRKTQRVLADQPVEFLSSEPDCVVTRLPCAAVAGDRAVVLGPGGDGLRLRQTGFDAGSIRRVEAELLGAGESAEPPREMWRDGDGWRLVLPPAARGTLRVSVVERGQVSVADFELR